MSATMIPGLSLVLLAVFGTPIVMLAGLLFQSARSTILAVAPLAVVPALLTSWLITPDSVIDIPWLLLGTRLGIDETGKVFLFFTAVLWGMAGWFAQRYLITEPLTRRTAFFTYYLLAMAGNLGLIVALDMASFFMFYALMSFSAYGLVVHTRDEDALRAGKIYIALVMVGEVLLFSAISIFAADGGNALPISQTVLPDYLTPLVLLGFGIKAGALPLHIWLPLAHPAAPAPASAVLSGAMIKAGLLGWLRFLPLGTASLPDWGVLCVVAGFAAAFYGVIVGLFQHNPKTVLAYSSISQMGLMTIAVGLGLAYPQSWPVILAALLFYVTHHAFAKGALFLGVGVAAHAGEKHPKVIVLILLPSLALAGAPLTSGAGAKTALKTAVEQLPLFWTEWVLLLLPIAALGTTLLMARFVVTLACAESGHHQQVKGLWLPWLLLIFTGQVFFWVSTETREFVLIALHTSKLWVALWPVLLASIIAWSVWHFSRKRTPIAWLQIPAGDVLLLYEHLVAPVRTLWSAEHWSAIRSHVFDFLHTKHWQDISRSLAGALLRMEIQFRQWLIVGVAFLSLFVLLVMFHAFHNTS